MVKISKKKMREIKMLSVFDEIYRTESNSRYWTGGKIENGMALEPFYVEHPDTWSDEEKDLFNIMTLIEDSLKEKIINILEA